ncbi:MAG TPA: immunoglobulin domain-containing protein, partial [Methylomirabilota bacterium]|nr:immunoglobulin domain-containing protein [Methylomirabilota bacterium]
VPPPNEPPVVVLTSPPGGSVFPSTAAIPLAAMATDSDGEVRLVEFLADGSIIGTATNPPFVFDWIGAAPGTHELRARAQDDDGDDSWSAPVVISVAPPPPPPRTKITLVSTSAVWKYLDTGADPGVAWRAPDFDDDGWPEGQAELGYGDAIEGRLEATVIGFGPDPDNKFPTGYFRHRFVVENAAAIIELTLSLLRDDGAVVYLNGVEVLRSNLPEGDIGFTNLALVRVADAEETTFLHQALDPGRLIEGTNVLAVEVHQVSPASTDLSFALGLEAVQQNLPVILTQPEGRTVTAGDVVRFTVEARGRAPLHYQWFVNGLNPLGGANQPTLVLSNVSRADEGSYSVEVTNTVGRVVSDGAVLVVLVPPALVAEPQDLTVRAGETAEFTVVATGSGPLAYQWFRDGTTLLTGETAPRLRFDNVSLNQAGDYHVSVSNAAGSVTSRRARLTVQQPPTILTQPQNRTVPEGETVEFAVVAVGPGGLTYQWLFNEGEIIPDATGPTLTLPSVRADDAGVYRVRVMGPAGDTVSDPALLRVLVRPRILRIQPLGGGVAVTFETTAGLRYSLESRANTPTAPWAAVPGATKFPGTGGPATLADDRVNGTNRFYRLLVE